MKEDSEFGYSTVPSNQEIEKAKKLKINPSVFVAIANYKNRGLILIEYLKKEVNLEPEAVAMFQIMLLNLEYIIRHIIEDAANGKNDK